MMKYSVIIATTLIVTTQSFFTNTSCDTTADCAADEWCYDEWLCVPNCNIVDGVDCAVDIDPDYSCNNFTSECGMRCDIEGRIDCVEYFNNWDYVCSNETGFCVEVPCNQRTDPTTYCSGVISGEFFGVPILGECEVDSIGYYCEPPTCNSTSCPTDYYCEEMVEWCFLGCNIEGGVNCTSVYGPDHVCNDITGRCELENCANSDNPNYCNNTAGPMYPECWPEYGPSCGPPSCYEDTECDTGYVCANQGLTAIKAYCEPDCRAMPDYCDGDEYCGDDGYCTSYCETTEECMALIGDEYICDLEENECITACTNNTYCMETFDTDMTFCNNVTGQCEFACYTHSDCEPLELNGATYDCSVNYTYLEVITSNLTAGECELVPECIVNPSLCSSFSGFAGLELYCDEDVGECVPLPCVDDTNCSLAGTACKTAPPFIPVPGVGDVCIVTCMEDMECYTRYGALTGIDDWYCDDGVCFNGTYPTTTMMDTTTTEIVEEMVTTEEETGPDIDGVQGYGVMVVLGVITFMILYLN